MGKTVSTSRAGAPPQVWGSSRHGETTHSRRYRASSGRCWRRGCATRRSWAGGTRWRWGRSSPWPSSSRTRRSRRRRRTSASAAPSPSASTSTTAPCTPTRPRCCPPPTAPPATASPSPATASWASCRASFPPRPVRPPASRSTFAPRSSASWPSFRPCFRSNLTDGVAREDVSGWDLLFFPRMLSRVLGGVLDRKIGCFAGSL